MAKYQTARPTVAIIGAGRVGTALGVLLAGLGYPIGGVVCRTMTHAQEAVARIGSGTPGVDPGAGAIGAGIVLVSVPDSAIGAVITQIARARRFTSADLLVHTSGALAADVLRVPGTQAAQCLSLHPVQTIADRDRGAQRLRGAYFGLEGDPEAVAYGVEWVQSMGGHPLRIKPGTKALYHAAACMASNYLVTLIHASLSLYERAGLHRGEALDALLPLLVGTLDNARDVGVLQSLTGPIERADVQTIRDHLEALTQMTAGEDLGDRADPVEHLYRLLGLHTVELARQKSGVSQNQEAAAAGTTAGAYHEIEDLLRTRSM